MEVYDGLRYKLTWGSAESYMYLYIASRGICSIFPQLVILWKLYILSTFNYEDYTIFTCCTKLTSTQMWLIMDMAWKHLS